MSNNGMAESSSRDGPMGDPQADFTTVSWLLARPRLAYLYTELLKMDGWATTRDLVDVTDFSQSTVYDDLADLRETSLVSVREEGRERQYRAEPFKIGVITDGQLTTITPSIVAAIGQQAVDDDVSQFVEEYGVERLAAVVSYVKPYIDGRMTERIAARELDLQTLVCTTIMVALEDTVEEMRVVDPFFEDVRDAAEDGGRSPSREIRFDDHTRVILEPGGGEGHAEDDKNEPGSETHE